METIYQYWDICWWWLERCILWMLIVGLILCALIWVWDEIIIPLAVTIKEAWWRFTKRCPDCGRNVR